MSRIAEAAEKHAADAGFPTKPDWISNPDAGHLVYMAYEVRAYVADAFEAGARWAIERAAALAEIRRKHLARPGGCDAGLSAARRQGEKAMARELRDAIRTLAEEKPPCPACSGTGMIHKNCILR